MKKQTRACMAMAMAVAMTTATISSAVPGNGITAEAASIRLSKTKLTMKVGQSKQLTVKGTKKTVKWSVSNGKIVKVTKKGKVTAKKAGTAKVYAKVKGKKLTCKVKVTAASNKKATVSPSVSPTATATSQATNSSSSGSSSNSSSGSSSSKVTSTPTATTGAAMTPKATNAANETEEPTKTSKPGKTEVPEASDTPDKTKGPKETEAPKASDTPDKTKGPKETEVPESDAPYDTEEPKATKNPTVENLEIKVGETKSTTSDGVKFTYIAQENCVVIKMENTTKSAKSIEVSMDLFDLEGNKVSTDSFLYKERIRHLSAGKTYYGQVYNFVNTKISKYVVNSLEITSTSSSNVDCLSEITASPKNGTDTSNVNITLEYTGDTSKIDEDGITVYGSIVYYDAKNNIVDVDRVSEEIYPSTSKTITVYGDLIGEADHYEVVLCGAYYHSDSYEPIETDEPMETDAPHETPTASVEPTEAPEDEKVTIKVGETKTVKKDGIEFTFTTDKDGIIVQYKNTMNTGKVVYVTIDALNEKGEVATSYTHHGQYISAGKTFYSSTMLYDGEKGEIASYEVSSLEVNDSVVNGDCINNLTVTPAKGTDVERNEWTVKYNGDLSKVEGKNVHVEGSILYYNSDNRIIHTQNINEYIKFSSENRTGTLNCFSGYDEADHYEVVLCGGEYF